MSKNAVTYQITGSDGSAVDVNLAFTHDSAKAGRTFRGMLPPALVQDAINFAIRQVLTNQHSDVKANDKESWGDHDSAADAAAALVQARLDAWNSGVWSSGGGGARLDDTTRETRGVLESLAGQANMTVSDVRTHFKGRDIGRYWEIARVLFMRANGITDPNDPRVSESAMRALFEPDGLIGAAVKARLDAANGLGLKLSV